VKTSAALVKLIIFMIVTSMMTFVLAATIGNFSFSGKTKYHAQFSDVTGLLPGNEVRIAGVRVGKIDKVALKGKIADVTLSLDQKRTIPQSAILRLRYRNLVGERYIAVTEGPGSAAPLRSGATVPLAQTHNALDLTVLFNGFKPLFQALDPGAVNDVSFEIVKTLQGEGGTLESLMQRTASLTNTLADRDAVIGRVITNLTTVLATVDDRDAQLNELVTQLQRFSKGFADDRVAIGQAIAGISDLTTSTSDLLKDVRAPLKDDIAQLGVLSQTLSTDTTTFKGKTENTLDGVLGRLPNKLNRIVSTATYGSFFNFYLCKFDGRVVIPSQDIMKPTSLDVSTPLDAAARCHS
jgi:phospholipid/cholesterol/gamma-HCH transport system substrate-binding protein